VECLSHLLIQSHVLVHYIICGKQEFFCFRFFFGGVIVDRHLVIMGVICIGLIFYFMLIVCFQFFLWVVSTHALICLVLSMDGFSSLIFIYRNFL
jgi:hypothetical protein